MNPKNDRNAKKRLNAVEDAGKPKDPQPWRVIWVGGENDVKLESTDFTELLVIWPDERAVNDDAKSTN